MLKPRRIDVTVVSAPPGHTVVLRDNTLETLSAVEPVIAWRIETLELPSGRMYSKVEPLTATGDVADNAVGVRYPDGRVGLFYDAVCASMSAATALVFGSGTKHG